MIILTDVDEVLLSWVDSFAHWAQHELKLPTIGKLQSMYDLCRWLNVSQEKFDELVDEYNHHPIYFENLPAYPDAVEILPKLVKKGYRFQAITACATDEETLLRRTVNLEKHFPGIFEKIHCTGYKEPKIHHLRLYEPTYWVEDTFRHAVAGHEVGHTSILINRPHNLGSNHEKIIRVDNWHHIYELIIQH